MKIEHLFEEQRKKSSGAYYEPSYTDVSSVGKGRVRGAVKDWLSEIFKATPADLKKALESVMASPEYRRIIKTGVMKDSTTVKEMENGTLSFKGKFKYGSNTVYKVLANGKINVIGDGEMRNDRKVPKPILVAGNPVKSIEKTMRRSLDQLADIVEKRIEREE